MQPKNFTVGKELKRYLALGGIGITLFGVSYFIWKYLKRKQEPIKEKTLPKELVIKIQCAIKRELFPIFLSIAAETKGIMSACQLTIVPEEYKSMILERGTFSLAIDSTHLFNSTIKNQYRNYHTSSSS